VASSVVPVMFSTAVPGPTTAPTCVLNASTRTAPAAYTIWPGSTVPVLLRPISPCQSRTAEAVE
jgi:hypothetical protein